MNNYPIFYITTEQEFNSLKTIDKVNIQCQHCLSIFQSTKKKILSSYKYDNRIIQFCSQKCSVGHRSVDKSVVTNCKTCNTEITKRISEFNKSTNHFCSQSCSATFSNTNRAKYQKCEKTGILFSVLKELPKCMNCNKSFKKTRNTQICCSMMCTMEYHNKNTIAESICKRVDANRYDSIRKSARNYSMKILPHYCANCKYDKHFEVCHIKPIKDFDLTNATIYEINNKDNLIHLCPNCHWEFDNNQLTLEEIKAVS